MQLIRKFALVLPLILAFQARLGANPRQLSVEDFVKFAEYSELRLSPDGQHIAVVAPDGDSNMLVILDISNPDRPAVVSTLGPPPREAFIDPLWVDTRRLVYSTTRQSGALLAPRLTGRIFAVDLDGRRPKQLYGMVDGRANYVFRYARIIDTLRDDPDHIMVAGYTNDRENPVAEKINVHSGRRSRVTVSPLRRGGLLADQESVVRFAYGISDEFQQTFAYRPDDKSPWRSFRNPFPGDIEPLSFSPDNKYIYVGSRGTDALGLYRLDVDSGETEPVIAHERAEISYVISDPVTREVVGVEFLPDYPEVRFVDGTHPHALLYQRLMAAFPKHHIRLTSFTADGSEALVVAYNDRKPPVYYLLDTQTMTARFLLASRHWIPSEDMATREAFWIKARAGSVLQGYLTRPVGSDNQARLPMVVVVHGGPHGPRDEWAFDYEAQLLANRGYLVLQLNYRGSGGFGQDFEESGYGQWGASMQDDITDATLWAVKEGLADPERLCIYGASYGGFSVLAGLTREPDLYKCGFAFVGVYDLEHMKKRGNVPELLGYGPAYLDKALGTDAIDLRQRSPINHVSRIKAALYVVHGILDRQAHVDNYYRLNKALDEAGIKHQKLLVDGEAHGFYELKNRILLYDELLKFLQETIGPGWAGSAAIANAGER